MVRARTRMNLALAAAISATALSPHLRADVLQWDGNGAALPNPAGGAGSWDSSSNNWWNGAADQAYAANATPHDAVFGVAGGAVTIAEPISARSLTFSAGGYTLSGNTLTLTDASIITVANAGDTATLASVVAGTAPLTKLGAGTLTLSSAVSNSFAGANILGGTLSFNNTGNLGGAGVVTIDGGTLRMTGTAKVDSPATRSFVAGPSGATFNISQVTTGSNTGLTIAGGLSGPGPVIKSGVGTMRFDRAINTFSGGLTIADGVVRFNNNNDAGPEALRMNRITFGANTAQLNVGGSGSNLDASASDLRTGEWVSSGGTGTILAATTVVAGLGASGHNLYILALADGTFTGAVDNTITANAGTTGTNSKNGNLYVRGIATQTLAGTTNVNNTINVFESSGLKLTGSAAMTGDNVNLNLHGGTFTLDNSAINNGDRYRDAGSIEPRGGGRLAFVGNAAGSSETMGALQLGTPVVVPSKARSGALSVDIIHTAGASAATALNFHALQRDTGRATVDFSAHDGAGNVLPLGLAGNNPHVTFGAAPNLATGSGLFESTLLPGDVGWATVNGSSFATYGAAGVAPVTTTAFTTAGLTDNAQLSSSATLSGAADKSIATLAIAPVAEQTLDLTGSANLVTGAILLSGTNNFEIRDSGGGTGGINSPGPLYVHVPQATLKISVPVGGSNGIVKSGLGTLELAGPNTYTGATTLNAGVVRATSAALGSGSIELRGGVLELAGGGTFSRDLGTAPGQLNWTNTQEDRGGGGFAAIGAPVTLDFNGAGANDLFYEAGGFLESGYQLTFGSRSANAAVTWVDNLVLNTLPSAYNAREIHVIDNPSSTTDIARITGVISSDTAANSGVLSDVLKTGDGTLELAASNTYLGGTIIAEGTILAANDHALGADTGAYILLGNRGGSASAALLTSAPVTIARDITIQAGSSGAATLGGSTADASTFSGAILAYRSLTLTAATGGTVTIANPINNIGNSAITKTGNGAVRVRNLRASTLAVNAGTLQVMPDGSATGVSKVGSLTTAGAGAIDLTNNKLIVTTPGSAAGVTALVAAGRNGGAWNGPGIITSLASGNLTTLGVATASQAKGITSNATALWAGQTVSGSDTLVMFTYGGDANLDGKLNVDDYTRIDFNVPLGSSGWYNGDFNYDGKINVDDYTIIDFNVGIQGAPFLSGTDAAAGAAGVGPVLGVTAVPEPAALSLMMLTTGTLLRRRRR